MVDKRHRPAKFYFDEQGRSGARDLSEIDSKQLSSGQINPSAPPDERFIHSAWRGDLDEMKKLHSLVSINMQDPSTGATALHYAAAMKARPILNWLAKFKGIDYLILDKKGRLASVIAFEVAKDPVIGRFLAKKENEQARERGIDIRTLLASPQLS
ncbi:MAG: ankyrin repeat domain-containing protein [Arenibacter algicola]|nr:ankyrin repeat domain-containing protein [Arenibacter algicola]